MVEGTRLESVRTLTGTEGSNPSLSAMRIGTLYGCLFCMVKGVANHFCFAGKILAFGSWRPALCASASVRGGDEDRGDESQN